MSDWIFNEAYRAQYDLPPTQQREVVKRLAKKNIVDVTAASDEIMAVLRAVHTAYGNKKERARAASAKSRASKRVDDPCSASACDIEDAVVACEPSVCDVAPCSTCVAEAVPEPAQATPEAVAAPTPVLRPLRLSLQNQSPVEHEAPTMSPSSLLVSRLHVLRPRQKDWLRPRLVGGFVPWSPVRRFNYRMAMTSLGEDIIGISTSWRYVPPTSDPPPIAASSKMDLKSPRGPMVNRTAAIVKAAARAGAIIFSVLSE